MLFHLKGYIGQGEEIVDSIGSVLVVNFSLKSPPLSDAGSSHVQSEYTVM